MENLTDVALYRQSQLTKNVNSKYSSLYPQKIRNFDDTDLKIFPKTKSFTCVKVNYCLDNDVVLCFNVYFVNIKALNSEAFKLTSTSNLE